jgi:hypothetical protein
MAVLERYRHADPPFAIDLPSGLELGSPPGTLLVAVDPAGTGPSPFRANLTVVAQELPAGLDLDAYAADGLAQMERTFTGWRLIDHAATVIGELPAERTLGTYLATLDWTVSVTLEQWRIVHDGLAWIVSCSSDTGDYAQTWSAWTECVETLRIGAR